MAKESLTDNKKMCFVIAPIGELSSETRKRSDLILKYVISPAVEDKGFKAVRADQISEPGLITSQVIQLIVEAPLVIADLTDRNPNVFYELAIRHTIRKPLVQIIKKGESIPFDVAGTRTIFVDHQDLDSVESAKKEISAQIIALDAAEADIDTPISVAIDLQMLRRSDNPEERSLGDLLSGIADLKAIVTSIEQRISDPRNLFPREFYTAIMRRESELAIDRSTLSARDLDRIRSMAKDVHKELMQMLRTPSPKGLSENLEMAAKMTEEIVYRIEALITKVVTF